MSSQSIFEMLADVKKENVKIDSLKEDLQEHDVKMNDMEAKCSELHVKLQQVTDMLSGKVRQDELYEHRMKTHRDLEELKKMILENESGKKDLDRLGHKFAIKDEFDMHRQAMDKELNDLKLCLATYVKNCPSQLTNKDYERRLKMLEDARKIPVPVNRSK